MKIVLSATEKKKMKDGESDSGCQGQEEGLVFDRGL